MAGFRPCSTWALKWHPLRCAGSSGSIYTGQFRHLETDKSPTGCTLSQAEIKDIIPESELRETLAVDSKSEDATPRPQPEQRTAAQMTPPGMYPDCP